jgi:two-component system, LytTR family, sensor kinase
MKKCIKNMNFLLKSYCRICLVTVVFLVMHNTIIISNYSQNSYSFLSNKKIKYTIINNLRVDFGNLSQKNIDSSWFNYTTFDWDQVSKNTTLLFGVLLPANCWDEPSVYLSAYFPDFNIWLNNKIIYQNNSHTVSDFNHFSRLIVPLDSDYKGKELIVQIPITSRINIGNLYDFSIGNSKELITNSIKDINNTEKKQIFQLVVITIILFTSFLSLLIFFLRWKQKDYPFLFYSLASLTATFENVDIRLFHSFANISPEILSDIESVSRFTMVIFFILFIQHTFNLLRNKTISFLWKGFTVIAIIDLCFHFFQISPRFNGTLGQIYSLVGFLALIVCVREIIISKSVITSKAKIPFYVFISIFTIIIIYTSLSIISIERHREAPLIYGLLSLSFAMISLLAGRYIDSIEKNMNYKLEIEKNRNEMLLLQQTNTETQFEALKSQINPHFLFNSLSALSSLCYPAPQPLKAKQFIDEFSKIFRYVLDIQSKNVIELKNELDFVNSYVFLQKIRFTDGFRIEINLENEFLNYLVPPFSLQILIENAIKHNITSKEKPLLIEIFNEKDILTVRNNLQRRKVSEVSSTKMGQKNITELYLLLTDVVPEYLETEKYYIAKIPLLKDE